MIARRDPAHALGEQHPLEPARPATTARPDPLALHARYADSPTPVPAPTRPRWPWQPFAAAPILAWLIVKGGPVGLVLGSLGIIGVFWWLDRWIDRRWEQTKKERGW